ncbi:hypothetical protein ACHAXN_008866 [Cyclotella atomus]
MNLNFLDPSKLPDRIDSTLVIPRMLHPPMPEGHFDSSVSKSTTTTDVPDVDMKDATLEEKSDSGQSKVMSAIPKKKPKLLFKQTISLNQDVDDTAKDGEGQAQQTNDASPMEMIVSTAEEEEGEVTQQQKQPSLSSEQLQAEPSNNTNTTNNKTKKKRKDIVKPSATKEDLHATAWTACNSISFNQNGAYLSSGHASGLVSVHSFASRCLNAVYSPPDQETLKDNNEMKHVNGTTSLCWNRSGRYLLAGAYGDTILRYVDNSHPCVAWECAERLRNVGLMGENQQTPPPTAVGGAKSGGDSDSKTTDVVEHILKDAKESVETVYLRNYNSSEEVDIPLDLNVTSIGTGRLLTTRQQPHSLVGGHPHPSLVDASSSIGTNNKPHTTVQCIRHPYILYQLPQPLGGTVQLHSIHDDIGLVCMMDGSLALFHIPSVAFYQLSLPNIKEASKEADENLAGNLMYLIPPPTGRVVNQYSVLCATFGKGRHEKMIYALTKCGSVMSLELTLSMVHMLQGKKEHTSGNNVIVRPVAVAKIPGGANAIQITANERFVLVNSCDALRLYNAEEFKTENDTMVPEYVFMDPVSKAPWISCDFLLDEYVVGGCNSNPPGDNYQLFLWNAVTGELLDQLTGPQVTLYCLDCHPTRPFIAVGTSDGMVDVWGYRTDWIAFAPDFQALQQNVLYEEKEDEFDVVVDDGNEEGGKSDGASNKPESEDEHVDILTKMESPALSNDSDQFCFGLRVLKMIPDKPSKKTEHDG